ncbi:fibrinogen-like protein 1 isoform X1 [Haliotis rufescens]|uniref:fibrinogen-like protein 1 isoform X1 n=1 Tax=Haliotis rufescens TaxID=6454 RepID=UPI001EAFF474|nr:fibrinogen-like protein 1 isoform X1 [Haliotis rufescens]
MGFKSSLALVFLLTSYVVSASGFKGFKVVESCVDPNSFNGGPVAQAEGHSASACAILCSNETRCRSFTFRLSSSTCFLHGKYITDWPCGQSNDVHYNDVYNPCQHGGDYNAGTDVCQCYNGYLGNRCERLMTDCSDGVSYYSGKHDKYLMQPSLAPRPFTVYCEMHYGGRTMFLRQKAGNENFNRSWKDYKQGFGDVTGDHWLGNDYIHYISSSRKHSLLVEIVTNSGFNQYYMQDFSVGDESSKYRLSFGHHFTHDQAAVMLEDCLGPLLGSSFSTTDQDNDNSARNCAQDFQSGWWFKDCSTCNPTGVYEASPVGGQAGGADSDLHWTPGKGLGAQSPRTMLLYLVYNDPHTWG